MNLFQLFSTFFGMIGTFIHAIDRLANAGDKYCAIAESHADTTHKQYLLESEARTRELEQQLQALENTASVQSDTVKL